MHYSPYNIVFFKCYQCFMKHDLRKICDMNIFPDSDTVSVNSRREEGGVMIYYDDGGYRLKKQAKHYFFYLQGRRGVWKLEIHTAPSQPL